MRDKLIASTPLAWVTLNKFVNETQAPIEFTKHKFLIDPFADMHPDQVVRKSAQVGYSVTAILKSIWLAQYRQLNIIYALPTNDIIKGFVQPKVDSLITSNPLIRDMVTVDSVSLKQIGKRFIHFKGTGSQREAISTSADLLIIDEYDRALDMTVVNTFDSRLQASDFGWRWRFSNPSGIGFGVDALYQDSDQMHWFIKCSKCNHEWFIDFEPEGKQHFVDKELRAFVCGKCKQPLSTEDRQHGRWVAKYPSREHRRGYWISQLMAPWVTAERVMEQFDESNLEFFNNFVLGKAYTPSDLIVNRATILRACSPGHIHKRNVAIGVDQNVSECIWVAATPEGVFAHGRSSWEEVERMKLMWDAIVVCDPNPYPTMPTLMASKYNDWYLCYFKESRNLSVLEWKNSTVFADRTRLLDIVANEITEAKLLFREAPYALEDYIADWQNLYRTTVEETDGRSKSKWLKKDNKESDFSLATAYMRVGLSRIVESGGSTFIEPEAMQNGRVTDTLMEDGTYETTLNKSVRDTLEQLE